MTSIQHLLEKYNVPAPRYTSYPTVPFWNEKIDTERWLYLVAATNIRDGISLYIHLPFCESLCTYCGCNKKITSNHSVEAEYIDAIHREWNAYRSLMVETPVIGELHLGGGTPTFFSPANLEKLLLPILDSADILNNAEFSFEGHPNNTTREHLQKLYELGFRRVSYGVQDNDPNVQRIINRIQPFENVARATDAAREIGYRSVNFDLIYGLPSQTQESIIKTISQVITLMPDRIAFYSYAHVPWTSRGQRLFDENDLPTASEKLQLYTTGKELLLAAGYRDIGMDHFALPHDDLFLAREEGRLNRTFMGYTTQNAETLIGLGVSAISSLPGGYAQNEKTIHDYYGAVNRNRLAVKKGYFTTEEDKRFGKYIREIACQGRASFDPVDLELIQTYSAPVLDALEKDGLIVQTKSGVTVTGTGKSFIRNICSAFDLHLIKSKAASQRQVFSSAI
ncbi:MAG: oxygen-independent coproporphyrinogen III oxidase [Bacteroidetes bacterium]|nr:oxygen-independent coproporphyrinogen III oxidase [Bacteroidota bacterium]